MKIKKLLLTIACFVIPMLSYAQAQEHLTFKNIPINGTVSQFAQKLVAQGYSITATLGNNIALKGEFLGQQCDVVLAGTKNKIIYTIAVVLPEQETWQGVKSQYFRLKEQYQQKYGEGQSTEEFLSSYKDGDRLEMYAIKEGLCKYITTFECGITITIMNGKSYLSASVVIVYVDPINLALFQQEQYNEI